MGMRATGLLSALVLLFLSTVSTIGANLPEESQQLLNKLKEYEVEQTAAMNSTVMEKRETVSKEFKTLAVSATKGGDLDRANLINHFQLMLDDSSREISEIVESDLDLPDSARIPLDQLADFKEKESARIQLLIAKKREAVIRVLNTHLQQALRRGDLEAANALKKSIAIIREDSPSNGGKIPDDAVSFNGRMYKIYPTDSTLSWEEAREECQKLGGDLGWALGKDGETMLRSLMAPFVEANGHCPVWVGGYRNESDEWQWLDGSKISDDFWPDGYDRWKAPNSIAMVRWIGSYRSINPEASQPKGFLCVWE